MAITHVANWYAGWGLVLSAFVVGAALGLFFHHDGFLGGYASFRRRVVRLGHIALAALGMMNVLYALSPWPVVARWNAGWAGLLWIIGAVAMPAVCFLTGWRASCRNLFFIPVASLVAAVVLTLIG
ncbi:MAG TPA: hypothetical protein VH475_18175 [Tepidisphaeraceae bacterium]|jgi:hypothetical protein